MTKILIAGIGGVGGWFGGLLAKKCADSAGVQVNFLARGEHLKQIQANGLQVFKGEDIFTAKPHIATDNANEIGIVDYILLCTKSYDLEKTIEQLRPCIAEDTIIIPFLNGVDSCEKIKALVPGNLVAGGCVYIVSSIKEPGIVQNTGNMQKLFFGLDGTTDDRLAALEKIMLDAGIEATLSTNISALMWEKFYLVGANSTATSYYNNTTGEILENEEKATFLFSLLNEINDLAISKGLSFDKDMVEVTKSKLLSFPYNATSSMQRDFWKGDGKTELETITGYIVKKVQQTGISTPSFQIAYEALSKR